MLNNNRNRKEKRAMPDFLTKLPPEAAGVLMAMFIAALRVVYDREETKPMRILLESGICGGLSLTASSGILAMGLDMNWAIFAGGAIGYFGSATVRQVALKVLNARINSKK